MKSVTLHKLDDELASRLDEKAKSESTSINQVIKSLLRGALGLNSQAVPDHRGEFQDLFGTWSERDAREFAKRAATLREIDPSEW